MVSDTLLIKHLPHVLTENDSHDLLRHFGAVEVKFLSSKVNKYSLAFARFPSPSHAEQVLHKLHQQELLGSVLSVEFSRRKCEKYSQNLDETNREDEKNEEVEKNERYYKKFIEKINSWHSSVNFRQPVPSHLRYQYPPPSPQVLLNITKALASVPKFYTQVLHLMNKMNLPCPFGQEFEIEMDVGVGYVKKEEHIIDDAPVEKEKEIVTKSDSDIESEISSEEDVQRNKEIIPITKKIGTKKKIKRPKFVKVVQNIPTKSTKKTKYEDVFETVDKEPKKLKLSYPPQEVLQNIEQAVAGFGFIQPIHKINVITEEEVVEPIRDEREEERLEKEPILCITSKELESNRIPKSDHTVLPVFKNYLPGIPSCKLYIKNLAKTVTEEDLKYIYLRYLLSEMEVPDDVDSQFEIRLLKEGRMKGQAFVTLQTVEQAQKALEETNGYILKDKPMVVQFGRVTK